MGDEAKVPQRKVGPYERSLLESGVRQREQARRAAQQRRRRLRVAAVVAVSALIAVAVGGVSWWLGRPKGAPSASGAPCAATTAVRIWAAPAARPALEAAAKAYAGTDAGRCLRTTVEARTPGEVLADLGSGKPVPADAWLTDSAVWVKRVNTSMKPAIGSAAPFARSPLVLATSAAAAGEVPADWRSVLTHGSPARLSDPATTTAGLLAVVTAQTALGADAHTVLPQLSQSPSPSTTDLVAGSAKDSQAGPSLAAEADVIAHNRSDADHPVTAVVPGHQTVSFEYSLVGLATDAGRKQAVDGLRTFLASKDATEALAANGLRPTADPEQVPNQPGAVTDAFTAPVPTQKVLGAAWDAWRSATIDFRVLAVVDVSGSMRQRVGGSTRIDRTQQAAQRGIAALPKSTEVGLWAFSVGLGPGGLDHEELVPVGPLDDEQQLGSLSRALTTLPRQVGGGTALYDTIWAAYQRVLDGWDEDRVNAVVILTDGRNQDPNGISLSQLKERLATADPKRPVVVATIGIGTDVDAGALSEISTMMHSSYYPARQPEDISEVLAKALAEHTCTDGVCA